MLLAWKMSHKSFVICFSLTLRALLLTGCSERQQPYPIEPALEYIPNPEKQVVESTESIKHYPNYFAPYHNRGLSRRLLGDFSGAVADLSQAIELDPTSECSYTYLQRGIAYAQLNDFERAITDLNQSLALNPMLGGAFFNRAEVYLALNSPYNALNDYNSTIDLGARPEIMIRASLQRCSLLAKHGNVERAVYEYGAVLGNMFPDDPRSYFYRADTFWKMGEYESALADYAWAIWLTLNGGGRQYREDLLQGEYYFFNDPSDRWQRLIDQLDSAVQAQKVEPRPLE